MYVGKVLAVIMELKEIVNDSHTNKVHASEFVPTNSRTKRAYFEAMLG